MSANDTPRESTKGKLTGFKVLLIAVGAFGVILTANLILSSMLYWLCRDSQEGWC